MTWLLDFDHTLFHFFNSSLSNPVFDWLCPLLREKLFWAPLYLFIAAFSLFNFGKRGRWILIGLALAIVLSDQISSELVKKNVRRLRPCNESEFRETVRLRADCGSGYSFTSSHAANHFAAAVFLAGVFGKLSRCLRPALLIWAGTIAFSQVYVGIHFPGDVVAGALLGSAIGWWMLSTFRKLSLLPNWLTQTQIADFQ